MGVANAKLAKETGSQRWISILAAVSCLVALGIMVFQFAQDPETRNSAYAVVAVILLALVVEVGFRAFRVRPDAPPQPQHP